MRHDHPDTRALSSEVFAFDRRVLDPIRKISLLDDVYETSSKRSAREQIALNFLHEAERLEAAAAEMRAAAKRWALRASRCAPGDVSEYPVGDSE